MKYVGLAAIALAAAAGAASAGDMSGVNGYSLQARRFNDFGGSHLLVNGTNQPAPLEYALGTGQSGPIVFDEKFAIQEPGNFANKHVAWLSTDGGATRNTTNRGQTWSIDFDVRMIAPAGQPRKEAGIEFHQPRPSLGYTDEGQLLIASDGEVAVFGATLPFTGFGPAAYTLGQSAHVSFNYFAPGTVHATQGGYRLIFTDPVSGVHDSGIKLWGVEPDGITGLTDALVGLKAQNTRNPFIADDSYIEYKNIVVTPAPGAFALVGLAGLVASRRRRA